MTEATGLERETRGLAPLDENAATTKLSPPAVVSSAELPLHVLMAAAQPLVNAYFQAQREEQEREFAHDQKVLEYESKQTRTILIGTFSLAAGVLIIAAVLIGIGRDGPAVDLIQLVVALAGAGLGGYGIAKGRRASPADE